MHQEPCRVWADFRDNDDADVAILTGVGDAFCAGADLATFVPINYVDATPSRVRDIVDMGLGGLTRDCIGSSSRPSPPSTGGR